MPGNIQLNPSNFFKELFFLPNKANSKKMVIQSAALSIALSIFSAGIVPTIVGMCWITRFVVKLQSSSIQTKKNARQTKRIIKNILKFPGPLGKEHVSIAEKKLKALPPDIEKLNQVRVLEMNKNELRTLPPKIGKLSQLITLDLSDNQLRVLPPEIGKLTQLKHLFLRLNQLKDLTHEIGNLTHLNTLSLWGNQLEILPSEIGNLSQLKHFNLDQNQLKEIPPEIDNLINLETLSLNQNQISSLPSRLGGLRKLRTLNLSHNSKLRDLPLSLGQIPTLIEIDINGTAISNEQKDAILNQCQVLRRKEASKIFPQRLAAWNVKSQGDFDLTEIMKYDDSKTGILNEWLVRLENTCDFRSKNQEGLAKLVLQILLTTTVNQEFNEHFFAQAEANNADCQDRAAMALNEIYTSWKLTELEKEGVIKNKLELMARGAKTIALRQILAQEIDKRQKKIGTLERESVEIYLYYETTLLKPLNLLSAIETMGYEAVGKRSWIDAKQLIHKVNESYLEHLVRLDFFEKLFENEGASDATFKENYAKNIDPLEDKIYKLHENKPKNIAEESEENLNWACELGKLNSERKLAMLELKKQWVKRNLSP